MAVTKITSTLGEITTNFLLSDFEVYIQNTSSTGNYQSTDYALLGFTGLEKSITRNNEVYKKEKGIPRVPAFEKTIRSGMSITTDLSNYNPDLIAIFDQASTASLGATGSVVSHGTSQAVKEYRAVLFTGTKEDNSHYGILIPKCGITISGDTTVGGEEESKIPLTFEAIYNPAANGTGNLYQELFLASTVNATSVVPVGY